MSLAEEKDFRVYPDTADTANTRRGDHRLRFLGLGLLQLHLSHRGLAASLLLQAGAAPKQPPPARHGVDQPGHERGAQESNMSRIADGAVTPRRCAANGADRDWQ